MARQFIGGTAMLRQHAQSGFSQLAAGGVDVVAFGVAEMGGYFAVSQDG